MTSRQELKGEAFRLKSDPIRTQPKIKEGVLP